MLKNTKYKVNLNVFAGYVDKRRKKRKREKKKKKKKAETIKGSCSKLEQTGGKSKFKEASHLPISPVRDQLW